MGELNVAPIRTRALAASVGPFAVELAIHNEDGELDVVVRSSDDRWHCAFPTHIEASSIELDADDPRCTAEETRAAKAAQAWANGDFHAHARTDVVALLAEIDELRRRVGKLQRFKEYVHKRLDLVGVPNDPEPAMNAQHGCRVEGRLNWLVNRLLPLNLSKSATWPYVLAFAQLMEKKLDENRHKGNSSGWRFDRPAALFKRLDEEIAEMKTAWRERRRKDVPDEAADVANFAMMIADIFDGVTGPGVDVRPAGVHRG